MTSNMLTLTFNSIYEHKPIDGEWVLIGDNGEWAAGRAMELRPEDDGEYEDDMPNDWYCLSLSGRRLRITDRWARLPMRPDASYAQKTASEKIVQDHKPDLSCYEKDSENRAKGMIEVWEKIQELDDRLKRLMK